MLIERKEYTEPDNSIGYIESIFESSNILKTIYFPKKHKLFISFNKGNTYSYTNITDELYKAFETSESQGKFLVVNIKKNPNKYPYAKEFSLNKNEIKTIKQIITKHKKND